LVVLGRCKNKKKLFFEQFPVRLVSKLAKTAELSTYKTCFCKNSKREFYSDFELYEKVTNRVCKEFSLISGPEGSILS
jgi:hypothetical protein